MAIRKSVAKAGLDGFKSWLQEHFPGHRLAVSHSRDGDDYLCSLKFLGVILAQAKAATQKLSAEKAAAEAQKLCSGDPSKLRGILRLGGNARAGPLVEAAEESENVEVPPATPPHSESIHDKKNWKLVLDLAKQLEQAQSVIQSQAKDLKRLKRELADLQNLNLASKIETASQELNRLKATLRENVTKRSAEPSPELAATLAGLEHRLKALESTSGPSSGKGPEPLAQTGSDRTYRDFKEALLEWAPDYADMAVPIVTALLAFKLIVLPRLSILRACQEALGGEVHLAVISAEPGWVTTRQALTPGVLREFKRALDFPQSLHLVVFDGLNQVGLNTWARAICHWASALISPPDFPQQTWPANLRVCFVPAQVRLSGLLNQQVAAIPPMPEKDCGLFSRLASQAFVGKSLAGLLCQKERLKASLKLLGHLHLVDEWEAKLLRLWPAVYQGEAWWDSSAAGAPN